ncbi:MAG: hypothetical protein IK076_01820 [Bacteroidales bacterium]|nr:hypothetical protein [Bacteroidales bacterium]
MNKLIKVLSVALVVTALSSCVRFNTEDSASATYQISSTFELNEQEYSTNFVDGLAFLPKFYFEEISYMQCLCSDLNVGYVGGFKLSINAGGEGDSDDVATFTSSGPYSGALGSTAYAAFYDTGFTPDYDLVYNLSYFKTATNYVVNCMVNNSEFNSRLADAGEIDPGDVLMVTAYFYDDGVVVGTSEKILVDYRDGNKKVVKDWEVWNMEPDMKNDSGSIHFNQVKFKVHVSGTKLRPCFCMDNFTTILDVEY